MHPETPLYCAPRRRVRSGLVLHPGALGDVLCARPALAALHARFPDAEITLATPAPVRELFKGDMECAAWDTLPVHQLYSRAPDDSAIDAFASYDCIVSWTGATNATFLENMERLANEHGAGCCVASPPPAAGHMHAADYLVTTVTPLTGGGAALGEWPRLTTGVLHPEHAEWIHRRRARGKILALHPGGGSAAKTWPLDNFVCVAGRLREKKWSIAVLLGPAEEHMDWPHPDDVVLRHRPLDEAAALMSSVDAYLGNDSGVTHLAAHLGCPTVALFGPTHARVWAPHGPRVRIVQSPESTMEGIPVDTVMRACAAFTEGCRSSPPEPE